jgi:AcrR family transcriptional regulator
VAQRLRRTEQVERNRDVVLGAALRVFLAKGYAGATVEAIANEAGFSTGVVYSQFGSKADLFLALLERRIGERAAQNERVTEGLSGAAGVRALVRVASRDAVAEPGWSRVLVEFRLVASRDPELNDRYAGFHDQSLERLASVLSRLFEGMGPEPTVPFRTMAEFIFAVGVGTSVERAANPAALSEAAVMVLLTRAFGVPDTAQTPSVAKRPAARRPTASNGDRRRP